MKNPIITVYYNDSHNQHLVHFLRRLRDDRFNPFVTVGDAKVYCDSILILSNGRVILDDKPHPDTVATISWNPDLEPHEMLFARSYYEDYYMGLQPLIPEDYQYMLGLGYFSAPAMARPVNFEELMFQMDSPLEKRKCMHE